MRKNLQIRVFGNVQGVGYRAAVLEEAKILNLAGWVRNEPDGSVLIVAEGSEAQLAQFIDWVKHGSKSVFLEKYDSAFSEELENIGGFEVKY